MSSKAAGRAGQRSKSIEEVVSYAIGHRIRVQILVILSEGVFTPDQIAQLIGEPTNKVSHHIKELLDAGSIELAKTERVRNTLQHFYRAVEMPYYSDEEVAAMTQQQRQVTAGLCLQQIMAEAMAAFWAGNMVTDPRVWITQRWFNVDEQGRQEIADEQARSWERVQKIEVEALNRCAKTDEETHSVIVAQLGFLRERKGPTVPSRQKSD
ncbi:MAG TPA: winged helix-turn-helix domain-containing protein [Solirubrobacterales bacterium]|nr:winged helix-turn-helix domain-containing protein [Solirubrobacterales bacterium]